MAVRTTGGLKNEELSHEVRCELLRALINVDEDETLHDAFYEAWDCHREEAGPLDHVVTDLHQCGLIEARQERERVYELGNDRPMLSTQLVVKGITAAERAFVHEQCA